MSPSSSSASTPGSGLLREGRHDPRTGQVVFAPSRHAKIHGLEPTQTERRFDLVELDRFRYDTPGQITAWIDHLTGIEDQLRLFRAPPGMLTQDRMPEYLFERTNGVVGLLERLIEDGCHEAVDSGGERLTESLLDDIAITVGGAPGRDPGAGEIPDIPATKDGGATKPAASGKAKRGRNTVLDDHGPAAASGA